VLSFTCTNKYKFLLSHIPFHCAVKPCCTVLSATVTLLITLEDAFDHTESTLPSIEIESGEFSFTIWLGPQIIWPNTEVMANNKPTNNQHLNNTGFKYK